MTNRFQSSIDHHKRLLELLEAGATQDLYLFDDLGIHNSTIFNIKNHIDALEEAVDDATPSDDNPFWIVIDDGDTFEGHQGHFADVYFSNATIDLIVDACLYGMLEGSKLTVRRMTGNEVVDYPEAVTFRKHLFEEYGEE